MWNLYVSAQGTCPWDVMRPSALAAACPDCCLVRLQHLTRPQAMAMSWAAIPDPGPAGVSQTQATGQDQVLWLLWELGCWGTLLALHLQQLALLMHGRWTIVWMARGEGLVWCVV